MSVEKKATTIYDIAKSTNLSAATVSRVLNGKKYVSEKTRNKVVQAAKKMNYSPNLAARSLKTKTSNQIMLSIPHLSSTFYFDLIEAVQQMTTDNNYSLLLNHTHASENEELNLLKHIKENHVDGLILISINISEKHLNEFNKIDSPIVVSGIGMNNINNDNAIYDYVGVDTELGLYLSTEHLIKQGHTRIGYVGLPLHTQTGDERFNGYRRAMGKWGLEIDPNITLFGGYTAEFGYNMGRAICNYHDRPTAIVTTCDHICLGLYRIFDEKGINIPGDIALVGMDNIEVSAIVKPKLSTVSIASAEIGRKAGELIFRRLSGWEAKKQNIIFEPRLIVRESSVNIRS
jgi:DNA-binding LacI/PurR family transcriptional regulator